MANSDYTHQDISDGSVTYGDVVPGTYRFILTSPGSSSEPFLTDPLGNSYSFSSSDGYFSSSSVSFSGGKVRLTVSSSLNSFVPLIYLASFYSQFPLVSSDNRYYVYSDGSNLIFLYWSNKQPYIYSDGSFVPYGGLVSSEPDDYLLFFYTNGASGLSLDIFNSFLVYPSVFELVPVVSKPGQYTSEQYKYLLLKRLQRDISMDYPKDRAYTYNFFCKLFEGVEVTEKSYNGFMSAMDDEFQYCADNNIRTSSQLATVAESQNLLLINAFKQIGVDLKITINESFGILASGDATFTKPDGTVMTYTVDKDQNSMYVNAKAGTEYSYAKQSAPYFQMEDKPVLSLDDVSFKTAGPGCYWSYNSQTNTMTITGDGAFAGATDDEQLGSGAYDTLIIGADVSRLLSRCLYKYPSLNTIVLLRSADDPLDLGNTLVFLNATYTWNIYTDNKDFRNYSFPRNMTITWHSLDEWEG